MFCNPMTEMELEASTMTYQPIENYGIIGDLHTVALVGMDGSIDLMSYPYFDSPTIFAALLDGQKGGHFKIAPVLGEIRPKQMYLPDTNVLISRFLSEEGVAEVSDFMPVEEAGQAPAHNLVRRAKTVRGEVHFRMVCAPRFDYARAHHRVEQRDGEVLFISEGADKTALRLRSAVPVKVENGMAIAEFCLRAGEHAAFILENARPGEESPSAAPDYVSRAFKDTVNYWHRWVGRSTYQGRWREVVNRSALTLKLLTSKTYGSVVAAPTFGLPEEIGGERNWDYRYTWIRDTSFTLYALIRLGYTEEAGAFMQWIEARCGELNPDGSLQIMYGIDGRHKLTEEELGHLDGYMGSRPVRVGNGAYDQLQLDIYGELIDSVYIYNKHEPISYDFWTNLRKLVNWVCDNWHLKDEGIWEVRGGQQEFIYSKLMCWVAVDRGLRLADKRSFPADRERWLEVRDQIREEIMTKGWSEERQAFVQAYGSKSLDASNLLMPMTFFIAPKDPRMQSTLDATMEDLVEDSLVFRYDVQQGASDGLAGEEFAADQCHGTVASALR